MSPVARPVHPTVTTPATDSRSSRGPMSRSFLFLSFTAALAAGCGKKPSAVDTTPVADPVVAIPLATVEERPTPELLTLTGNVVADDSSDVTASTGGKVVRVLVERGDHVKFGQALVQLDAQSAALSAAGVRAQLGAAKAQEQLANDECKRSQALYDKGAITQSQYEREMTSCTAAKQTVEATRAQLNLIGKSIADGVVRAPFAGVIADRWVSPGEWAAPGMRLVTLVDDDPMTVELSVPESAVPRMAVGQAVAVSAVAYPEQKFAAKVTRIGAEIGRMNRALIVEAELAPGSSLRPGMFAEASVTLGDKPMPVVPKAALVKRGVTWRLFVVVKGHLEERVVQLGPALPDGKVALLRGAAVGDKVAAAVDEKVIDGVRVEK
jgi:membrane fusion protein, multidrug efflux system